MKGFYMPGSRSGSYVASKRTPEGSFQYDTAASELGKQKQLALQNLGETYASTIENAYASYLANQRGIQASAMGQGYKEAYTEEQQKQLAQNIAQANLTAASGRSELETQEQESRSLLEEQYKTEVANLDRVANSFDNYLTYIKSLTGTTDSNLKYLSDEDSTKSVDELYEKLYGAQPQSLIDEEGMAGLPYVEWMQKQLGKSEADATWSQWLLHEGGLQDFLTSVQARKGEAYSAAAYKERLAEQEKETEALKAKEIDASEYINTKWDVGGPYFIKDIKDSEINRTTIANKIGISLIEFNKLPFNEVVTINGTKYIIEEKDGIISLLNYDKSGMTKPLFKKKKSISLGLYLDKTFV